MQRVRLRNSIQATLTSAQGVLVVVLIAISVVATLQFGQIAGLVSMTSDAAEALMRLTHALDLQNDTVRAYKAGYSEGKDENARAKFSALTENVTTHAQRAATLLSTEAERKAVASVAPGLQQIRAKLGELGKLDDDAREVLLIENEEALGDIFAQLGKSKLAASKSMETQLETVKVEVKRPVRLFWGAAGLGCLIALGVSLLLRRRVSQPIGALSAAVSELSRGRATRISVQSRDEMGVLGEAFNEMAATITERTRSLKLVFDSVGEGLITCDRTGKLSAEPSARALEWFGAPAAGSSVAEYLAGGDAHFASMFGVSFDQMVEEILPFELCADQMPSEVLRDAQIYELKYRQVMEDGEFKRVLVVARDVTEQRAMARKEREARDVYALSSFALRDPSGHADFTREVRERLQRAVRGEYVMMELHTVKGSASVIGCELFAEQVHACESHMLEHTHDSAAIERLQTQFQALCGAADKAVGGGENDLVMARRHEYHQLLSLMQVNEAQSWESARKLARSWSMHRIGSSFERLAKTGVRSAERQGKSVCVQFQGDQICVPKGELDELWSVLAHLVRNAVAHGIEPAAERTASGKSEEGRIDLRADVDSGALRLTVSDDGRGIDWKALRSKIGAAANDNESDLDLLCREGSSTAESVTDLSGRGVGMGAVRRTVLQLGGTMDVQSQSGHGTTVEIQVPVRADVYVPLRGGSTLLPKLHSKAPARPSRAALGS